MGLKHRLLAATRAVRAFSRAASAAGVSLEGGDVARVDEAIVLTWQIDGHRAELEAIVDDDGRVAIMQRLPNELPRAEAIWWARLLQASRRPRLELVAGGAL